MAKKIQNELEVNGMIFLLSLIQVLVIFPPEITKSSLTKYWLLSFIICAILRYCGSLVLYIYKKVSKSFKKVTLDC